MSEVAFLFPGQGAQAVGMGKDFADASPAAAKVYEEASDVLGWDVGAVCFEGPKEELDRTAISQPAILTTSLAAVAAMKDAGFPAVDVCCAAAGLSLGEYSALVMAGAMELSDAVHLVQMRGMFMEEASHINPGMMLSVIGLEDGIVEALCADGRSAGGERGLSFAPDGARGGAVDRGVGSDEDQGVRYAGGGECDGGTCDRP